MKPPPPNNTPAPGRDASSRFVGQPAFCLLWPFVGTSVSLLVRLPDGPVGALARRRLHREGRDSELLDLPQQFNEELYAWLQLAPGTPEAAASLPRLRWLHELRMQKYSAASQTLARLASSRSVSAQPCAWLECSGSVWHRPRRAVNARGWP
jgi:hypothetical protein